MMAALLAATLAILPPAEERVVASTAERYELTYEQTALLRAIRRAENGKPHRAWGIKDKRCSCFEAQCAWAANTIRRRYNGDLRAFAVRWCPLNWRVWLRNVRWFMDKQGYKK